MDIKEYVLKNGTIQKLVDGSKLTYEKVNGNVLLTIKSDYLPDGSTINDFTYAYNARTRLTEVTGMDGIKTAICWDINNYYPVVIGKNISYSNLSGALQSVNNVPNALYSQPATQQAQLSTFSYIPLVGLQSKTDARGITTYYSYDGLGRLSEIYRMPNGVKQTIQSYQYHFKP